MGMNIQASGQPENPCYRTGLEIFSWKQTLVFWVRSVAWLGERYNLHSAFRTKDSPWLQTIASSRTPLPCGDPLLRTRWQVVFLNTYCVQCTLLGVSQVTSPHPHDRGASGLPALSRWGHGGSVRWGGPPGITLLAGGTGSMTPSPRQTLQPGPPPTQPEAESSCSNSVQWLRNKSEHAQRSHHVKGCNFKWQVQNLREGKKSRKSVTCIYIADPLRSGPILTFPISFPSFPTPCQSGSSLSCHPILAHALQAMGHASSCSSLLLSPALSVFPLLELLELVNFITN